MGESWRRFGGELRGKIWLAENGVGFVGFRVRVVVIHQSRVETRGASRWKGINEGRRKWLSLFGFPGIGWPWTVNVSLILIRSGSSLALSGEDCRLSILDLLLRDQHQSSMTENREEEKEEDDNRDDNEEEEAGN